MSQSFESRLRKLEGVRDKAQPINMDATFTGLLAMHKAGTLKPDAYKLLEQIRQRQIAETGSCDPRLDQILRVISIKVGGEGQVQEIFAHDDSGEYVPADLPPGWGLLRVENGSRVYGRLPENIEKEM